MKVDHPHLIKFYGAYKDEKRIYIIMELCTGGPLLDVITKSEKQFFGEKDALRIMIQVFQAVSYCHSRSIFHREIHPSNILLMEDENGKPQIKLIHFGSTKDFDPKEKMKEVPGSALFMAPEIFIEDRDEKKCDIWSAGIILYILLVGEAPFKGNTDEEILQSI